MATKPRRRFPWKAAVATLIVVGLAGLGWVQMNKPKWPPFESVLAQLEVARSYSGSEDVTNLDNFRHSYLSPNYYWLDNGVIQWLNDGKHNYMVKGSKVRVDISNDYPHGAKYVLFLFGGNPSDHRLCKVEDAMVNGVSAWMYRVDMMDDRDDSTWRKWKSALGLPLDGPSASGMDVREFYFSKTDGAPLKCVCKRYGNTTYTANYKMRINPPLKPTDFTPEKHFSPEVVAKIKKIIRGEMQNDDVHY